MDDVLHTHDDDLIEGTVVSRPNRFVIEVAFDGPPERVFLGDPGELAFLNPGVSVLCSPVDADDRKTAYDAVAIDTEACLVSVKSALANQLFAAAIDQQVLPPFEGHEIAEREPLLPDHGRSDFILRPARGEGSMYVEVKSCTHVEEGVGKFPDRPTERGRRHLAALQEIVERGGEAHLVFVAQRPDIDVITPFETVDPEFADRLREAAAAGVGIHAMSVEFDPPTYHLRNPSLPVRIRHRD